MKIQLLIIALAIVSSCTTRNDLKQALAVSENVTEKSKPTPIESADTILYKNEVLHNFSSPAGKDTFRIHVTGNSIINGKARFQIISHSGRILLDESFPANYLIGYGLNSENLPVNEQEDFIKKRIDEFFKEANFSAPAIAKDELFDKLLDEDYSDKETWTKIKDDESAIGFYYLIGEEDGRSIAYSKAESKVVVYFSCC